MLYDPINYSKDVTHSKANSRKRFGITAQNVKTALESLSIDNCALFCDPRIDSPSQPDQLLLAPSELTGCFIQSIKELNIKCNNKDDLINRLTNAGISIGNKNQVVASATCQFDSSISSIIANCSYSTLSDVRDKIIIDDDVLGLKFLLEIETIVYKYNMRERYTDDVDKMQNSLNSNNVKIGSDKASSRINCGFSAQHIQSLCKKYNVDYNLINDPKFNNPYAYDRIYLNQVNMIPIIIKSVQELYELVNSYNDDLKASRNMTYENNNDKSMTDLLNTSQNLQKENNKKDEQISKLKIKLQKVYDTEQEDKKLLQNQINQQNEKIDKLEKMIQLMQLNSVASMQSSVLIDTKKIEQQKIQSNLNNLQNKNKNKK